MNSFTQFLDNYSAELSASVKLVTKQLFLRALKTPLDLNCLDTIQRSVKRDHKRFAKLCKAIARKGCEPEARLVSLPKEGGRQDAKLCCVCYEREEDIPLNCSHKLCANCYGMLTKCPMCREQYRELEPVAEDDDEEAHSDSDDDVPDMFVGPAVALGFHNQSAEMWYDGATFLKLANPDDATALRQLTTLTRTDIILSEYRTVYQVRDASVVQSYFRNKGEPLQEITGPRQFVRIFPDYGILERDSWQQMRYKFKFYTMESGHDEKLYAELLQYLDDHNASYGNTDDRQCLIEGIADADAVTQFFASCGDDGDDDAMEEADEAGQPNLPLVPVTPDDYRPIHNVRVYNLTYDEEHDYSYIEPADIKTDRRGYCEKWLDGFEFIYDTEHDTSALLKDGYQKVLGIAHEYTREGNRIKRSGTYYKTCPNGGIFDRGDEVYTWYFDGATCWLRGARDYLEDYEECKTPAREEDIRCTHTFDYNYEQFIKLETPADDEHMRTSTTRLHHKVCELQRKLAELRKP